MFDFCVSKFLLETWIYKTFEIYPVKNIENYVTFDELSQQQNLENVIVSGNAKSLPNSTRGDMGWLMDNYVEVVDILLNYTHFLQNQ